MGMKKTFLIEIDYSEKPENIEKDAPVLYDLALEVAIENFMEGYKATDSIESEFSVSVKEI